MPCYKGLALSIHTPDGPLSEYSVQKVNRASRISTYIPVPPPKISAGADRAEPSTFAISITLLTPGQDVPYSTPKVTKDNPHPKPRVVGSLPGHNGERGRYVNSVGPYVPLTTSPNETVAAYIYFDGRGKEEVATLLRKGEETWVNSRWVSVPESEGGGLAEREFLFREVGLENWLNGLDLEGQDAAAIIEKRRQKLEKRRRRKKDEIKQEPTSDDEMERSSDIRKTTLSYSANGDLKEVSDEDESDTSDEDDPIPEAAGQIKVALYRVLASGTVKKGEYSPQYEADEEVSQTDSTKDVDHTTGFAKPKTLDPSTISTQTVTGIDPTDKPYAVFTFFYRGERQLQKMGILTTPQQEKTPTAAKRKSGIQDLPALGPLKKEGTVGFVGYRDTADTKSSRRKSGAAAGPKPKPTKDLDSMQSDSDSEPDDSQPAGKMEDIDDLDPSTKKSSTSLTAEDAQVNEGIRKMKVRDSGSNALLARHGLRYFQLKRQHSAEPLNRNGVSDARKASRSGGEGSSAGGSGTNTPTKHIEANGNSNSNGSGASGIPMPGANSAAGLGGPVDMTTAKKDDEENGTSSFHVGSPFKRQRNSMADFDQSAKDRLAGVGGVSVGQASQSINQVLGSGPPAAAGLGPAQTQQDAPTLPALNFGGALFKKDTFNIGNITNTNTNSNNSNSIGNSATKDADGDEDL